MHINELLFCGNYENWLYKGYNSTHLSCYKFYVNVMYPAFQLQRTQCNILLLNNCNTKLQNEVDIDIKST